MQIPIYVFYLYAIASGITLALYALDKIKARRGSDRIPEKVLHLLELLGGWPGGLLGHLMFNHKSKKLSYQIVYWLIVLIHVTFWVLKLFKKI